VRSSCAALSDFAAFPFINIKFSDEEGERSLLDSRSRNCVLSKFPIVFGVRSLLTISSGPMEHLFALAR
jgi:hypothetical protein